MQKEMKTIVSLEFEHKKWSWGHTSQFLLNELNGFEIMSMEFKNWKQKRQNVDMKEVCFLSQNVSQLKELTNYGRMVLRLGGNRAFDNEFLVKQRDYFSKMAKCYAIVATNKKLENIARKVNANVYLAPNGLDLDIWRFKKRPLKRKDVLTVGFVGNVRSLKKVEYKGYAIIKNVCKKLNFPLQEALYMNKQISHNQMQEQFYSNIDVLALLTNGEGCSNTIMECLACGVPVITTKEAGFHGEMAEHEDNIFFCEKDHKSLFAQLIELNRDRNLLEKISIKGRIFAEKHHDIKIIAKKFQKIFEDCFRHNEASKLQEVSKSKIDMAIVCVLKSGGDYDIDYVIKLKNMIDKNTTLPYKFVCLTDMNIDKNICKSIKLVQGYPGWWSKVELFRAGLIDAKRIIYFDLDTIILKNIDDLLNFPYNFFALYPWNKKNRRDGLCASGMMAWKNDNSFSSIFDQFDIKKIDKYSKGDQEYISKCLKKNGKEVKFFQNLFSGIYSYKRNCKNGLHEDARIICFHGKPRLHEIKADWVKEHWK